MDHSHGAPAQQPLTVDLCGIIRIFGKALYNDFGAIVRELVQNGHDSVAETYCQTPSGAHALPDYWVNVKYNQLELMVADNGIGRPDGTFAQSKTGLGTGIVKALAQQLGAKVETLADPGGTTVSITHATFWTKENRAA